jgi:hypothetical protein
MPLPQVNDRIKEVPAQALRAVFAGIGQVLLVADKIRNRAVEQVSGVTTVTAPPREAPATKPATEPAGQPASTDKPVTAAQPTADAKPAAATGPGSARWRSLDKTGNVRLISEKNAAAPAPASKAVPTDAVPAEAVPTDAVPAEAVPTDAVPADALPTDAPPADAGPAEAVPAEVLAPEGPPAGVPSAEAPESPVVPPGANAAGLPLSNYDSLTIPSLRARLRVLSAAQVTALLDYERATQARPAVITMFERRLAKLTQEEG